MFNSEMENKNISFFVENYQKLEKRIQQVQTVRYRTAYEVYR